jgi:hypothetical protein
MTTGVTTITGHAPEVSSGPASAQRLDGATLAKLGRWQQSLDKATTPERRAAVQAEIDKLLGLSGLKREEGAARLRAELARLEG